MPESEYEQWIQDVHSCFEEAMDSSYRCTDGSVLKPEHKGIMKSGWFLTIIANSIGQLALHVLAMIRMDHSPEQILSEAFRIVAGGDDVLQTFPAEFDYPKYRENMTLLGFEVSDFKVHPSFEGCEFFSHVFKQRDGVWTYYPTRFTKHIVNLCHTKSRDLANALSCHMINHVWDNQKFKFFDTMYRDLRKTDPDQFPLSLLKSQKYLQYKVLGFE